MLQKIEWRFIFSPRSYVTVLLCFLVGIWFLRQRCNCKSLCKRWVSLHFFPHYKILFGYRKEVKHIKYVSLSFVSWDFGGRHAFCILYILSDFKIWKCTVIIKDKLKIKICCFVEIIMVHCSACFAMKTYFCSEDALTKFYRLLEDWWRSMSC